MKIIFAQGNPGTQYARTRHNVGFIVLDRLAEAEHATWRTESRYKAEVAEVQLEGEKVLLVKPQSFYNETGLVARAFLDFYKLESTTDLLVIHDELALPFGTVRVREKGSDAGNNGIKSLNSHIGQSYWRLRVGIWSEMRSKMDDARYVLAQFTASEQSTLNTILIPEVITPIIQEFARGSLASKTI